MSVRYPTTPALKGLFSNLPIESGLSDQEILRSVTPSIPHKTFSRLRIAPPKSLNGDQIRFIARFAQAHAGLDAAEVIATVRHPEQQPPERISILSAAAVAAGTKERVRAGSFCDQLIGSARNVCLFDRANSFQYLAPVAEDDDPDMSNDTSNGSRNSSPRITILVTLESLAVRARQGGDEAIETLIDHSASPGHHVCLIDDRGGNYARTHVGGFQDAQAIAVIDEDAMFVLPRHERSVRCYTKGQGVVQAGLIAKTMRHFRRLQQLCVPGDVGQSLRKHLSYRLPW